MVGVAVVGSGFAGIGAAVRLAGAGVTELVVFEKADDVGGVWRDNTYPGAACDVPSHLYSFSFAREGGWSRRFAGQAEIHAYLRRVARELGVLPRIRFGTEVRSVAWTGERWELQLSSGATHSCDVLVTACGQLSRPSVPRISGLASFAGTMFHSARWRHDHDLAGERVGVIGTGASAIQFVPEIVGQVSSLTLFQRHAPYVLAKPDREYGERTRALLAKAPAVLAADRLRTFVVNETRSLGFNTDPRLMRVVERRFHRHLARQVRDPALRAALTPVDPIGCKRILQSNDWYPALTAPQVQIVTSDIDHVEPRGVVTADGELHQLDTLVLGTGFTATELLAPMRITGTGGRPLTDAWARGAQAYLGTTVAGFPNLFLLYGPNTNLGHNSIVLMLESQFRYLTGAVRLLEEGRAAFLDVREQVQADHNGWLQQRLGGTVFAGGCTSWYLTADGRNTQNWPGSTIDFRRRLRTVRLEDFRLAPVAGPGAGKVAVMTAPDHTRPDHSHDSQPAGPGATGGLPGTGSDTPDGTGFADGSTIGGDEAASTIDEAGVAPTGAE